MNYIELQQWLQELTWDDSTKWVAWWTSNKASIIKGFEMVFSELKRSYVRTKLSTTPSQIILLNRRYTLPADFEAVNTLSVLDPNVRSDNQWDYFDYYIEEDRTTWAKTLVIETDRSILYMSYFKKKNTLSLDADIPNIPAIFHDSIIQYALHRYYYLQQDYSSMSNALAYANQYLVDKISEYASE